MSSEVGSGHVSIFPVMTGFKPRVTRETKAAGAAGAKSFEGGFKGAGVKAGRTLGRDLKSAVSSSAKDLGVAELGKLNAQVASASAALSKARLRQMDDAGKVRVAEVRLQEAVDKSGEGSARAIAAEERLAAARRKHTTSTEAVVAASQRLQSAQSSVRSATDALAASSLKASGGLGRMASDLQAGFKDARAAQSAFTGVSGSVGGLLRAASDVSGLSALGRIAQLTARQVSTSFTSLATMVGGNLAKAWTSSSRWLSGIGSSVATALSPLARIASTAGTALASPFIKLGSKVSSWLSPVTTQVSSLFAKVSATGGTSAGRLISSFRSGLSGIGTATASALKSVVSAAGSAGSAAGRALGAGIKNVSTGIVAGVGAAIGVGLTAGLSRLTALDTARAKLVGLGNDGKTVAAIMKNANASVKGTSFGVGEAAKVAAGAVAAGIKPGEGLQRTLKTIVNTASAAGTSMEDMGSIFNKAATQANGVQNDVIGQLADRGIPIYQALADQMGVTAGEVFKMASEGKVDFATFEKAAEAAAGTVAEEMGKTVPGAFKNMLASLGRSGAGIFGGLNQETGELFGLYARFGPLIQSVTSAMGPLEERATSFGETLDKFLGPSLDRITAFFNRIGEGASIAGSGLENIMGIAGPLGGVIAALGAGGLATLLARLGPLGALLPGLGGALTALASPLGIVALAFAGFAVTGADAGGLVSSITGIVDSVVAALPGLVSQIAEFVPDLVAKILAQVPALLGAGVEIVGSLVQGLVTALPAIATGAVALVSGLLAAIVSSLPMIIQGALQLVEALVQGAITAIPLLIEAALQLVSGLLAAIVSSLPMIIQGGIELLMSLVSGLISAAPAILQAALDLVFGLLTAILENLPLLIQAGIELILSLALGLIDALPQLITTAIELVLQLVVGLLTMLPKLVESGIELVVALIVGLVSAIPKIIEMLPQIVSAIWDGLMGVDWLDLGVQIVMGIINGLRSSVGAVVSAIVDLAGAAFDGFKDFFGIASPAKRMIQPGRDIVRGSVVGVKKEQDSLGDSLVAMADDASKRAQAAMSSASATFTASATAHDGAAASKKPTGPTDERGRTLIYNAAPNQSYDKEQDLRLALDRFGKIK